MADIRKSVSILNSEAYLDPGFASWKNTLLPWTLFDSLILAVGDRFFLYFNCTHSRTNTSGSHFRINTHEG